MGASPPVFDRLTTPWIHFFLFIGLLPVGLLAVVQYGWSAALVIGATVLTAWGADVLLYRWKKRPRSEDGSALLWGLLIAYTMPPHVFVLVPMAGALFAVWGIKALVGGGSTSGSWINPVLAAWAFCVLCWPTPAPVDGLSSATPLTHFKLAFLGGDPVTALSAIGSRGRSGFDQGVTDWFNNHLFSLMNVNLPPGYVDLITGYGAGTIGGCANLILLLVTLVFMAKRIIPWEIPLFFFAGFVLPTAFWGGLPFKSDGGTGDVLFQVFSGFFLMGAFLLSCDFSSRPLTRIGRIIFATGCGLFSFLLRTWGVFSDGVPFAILLMNLFVPFLDAWRRKKKQVLSV